jgi:anti-anti-sigma factor
MRMRVDHKYIDDIAVYHIGGQLMGGPEADELMRIIAEDREKGYRKSIFNLREMTWINSTGIGIFISAQINATRLSGHLALAGVGRTIESIFCVANVTSVFEAYQNEEQAVRAMKGEKGLERKMTGFPEGTPCVE